MLLTTLSTAWKQTGGEKNNLQMMERLYSPVSNPITGPSKFQIEESGEKPITSTGRDPYIQKEGCECIV